MHDGMPYGPIQGQGQGHSREVDRQSPTGLIFIIIIIIIITHHYNAVICSVCNEKLALQATVDKLSQEKKQLYAEKMSKRVIMLLC